MEKNRKKITDLIKTLDTYKAAEKKSNDGVAYLQKDHEVPRYWARTLTAHYLKTKEKLV